MGVGRQTDFDPNAFGPFGPLIQSYVTAFESLGRGPAMPVGARYRNA